MYPRRLILQNGSYSHVFFRCHNQQFFFKNIEVKKFLLSLWAKYKKKYKIQILEFIIMDNHAHLLAYINDVILFGHFMRTVNSQLARFINKLEKRDSQAIRERYKSPLITTDSYLKNTMQYIWLNRFKVDKSKPSLDLFCSVSWRLFGSKIAQKLFKDKEVQESISELLDKYPQFDGDENKFRRFIRDLLNAALSLVEQLVGSLYENSHTIGDKLSVIFRGELLSAFQREQIISPPS